MEIRQLARPFFFWNFVKVFFRAFQPVTTKSVAVHFGTERVKGSLKQSNRRMAPVLNI